MARQSVSVTIRGLTLTAKEKKAISAAMKKILSGKKISEVEGQSSGSEICVEVGPVGVCKG